MEGAAKNGDSMQKTKNDCVANFKKLYPDIKPTDMKTIVSAIFNLLNVTDKVEAQHTKKRSPKKMSPTKKANNDAFYAKKKQEAADRKNELPKEREPLKEYEESSKDRHTPRGREAQEAGWHVDTHR